VVRNRSNTVRGTKSSFFTTAVGLGHYSFDSKNMDEETTPVADDSAMLQGTIARLTDRGFGFITREGEDKDLFFHTNELIDVEFNDLREGDTVTFEVAEGPKGLNAVKIRRVS